MCNLVELYTVLLKPLSIEIFGQKITISIRTEKYYVLHDRTRLKDVVAFCCGGVPFAKKAGYSFIAPEAGHHFNFLFNKFDPKENRARSVIFDHCPHPKSTCFSPNDDRDLDDIPF